VFTAEVKFMLVSLLM